MDPVGTLSWMVKKENYSVLQKKKKKKWKELKRQRIQHIKEIGRKQNDLEIIMIII